MEKTVLAKKAPVNDFVRSPVPRIFKFCWTKIGNGVISMLWQLRCHCNPDHDKFSSTVVAIFPNVCLWRRSLCSNLALTLKKLYRATFICQYGLCCCNIALVSFRLFCKNLGHLRQCFGQMVYRPPPPPFRQKNFPYVFCEHLTGTQAQTYDTKVLPV